MNFMLKKSFQRRVGDWINACFGEAEGGDTENRNHRFLEEALELVQACGCTEIEARQLVRYEGFAATIIKTLDEERAKMVSK